MHSLMNRFDTAAPLLTRRVFLQSAGGLVIGFAWLAPAANAAQPGIEGVATGPLAPNAFVRVGSDNLVTIICKHHEMGQGNTTGLASLVADELDADWSLVRTEYAPSDAKLYNNLLFGPMQGTGGSSAIANSFLQYRGAGATARAMLVAAAAEAWQVLRHRDSNIEEHALTRLGSSARPTGRWRSPPAAKPLLTIRR